MINNSDDFDINIYDSLNNNLKNTYNEEYETHNLNKNILPNNFDVNAYRFLNPDLKKLNDEECKIHYLNYGIYENRIYKNILPDDFDVNAYRLLNPDLKNMNEEQSKIHYLNHGIFENRIYKNILKNDFDVNAYRLLNPDLKNMNEEQCKIHYLYHGIYENRMYKNILPNDFDFNAYRFLNKDLENMSNEECKIHYLNHGIFENRKYKNILPDDFDTNLYSLLNPDLKNMDDQEIKMHYLNYGIYENRIYKLEEKNYKILNNNEIINMQLDNCEFNHKNNIIISLTSIPTRFIEDDFEYIIDSLYSQLYKPKYIIINLCKNYKRNFIYDINIFNQKIEYYENKYENIIINFSEDYGPITKILGLLNMSNILDKNDKIIIVDDDWKFKNTMTYFYNIAYNLYNSEAVFIDERYLINWDNEMELLDINEIIYDNYQNFVYGWLTFSFKYKYINKLYDFYINISHLDENIYKHDDLILTLFYKIFKIYSCGISLFLNNYEKTKLSDLDGLKDQENTWMFRYELEKKILDIYNIKYNLLRKHIYIENLQENKSITIISNNIEKRDFIYNIQNIKYDPKINNYLYKHIDIKYYNENIFILTLTNFKNIFEENEIIILEIDNINIQINLKIYNNFSRKQTFFIIVPNKLIKIEHKIYDFNIVQTYNKNTISLNKFYSISTILNYIPEINYVYFNEDERINFIKNISISLYKNVYEKIIPGAFKADLFRALYIYYKGGIYFDCKNILFDNIYEILDQEESYVLDIGDDKGIYNGFLYCSYKYKINFKKYIIEIIYNIFNELYLSNFLEVTGPKLLNKFIDDNIYLKNNFPENDNWRDSYLNFNDKLIIKNSYYEYYDENNYLNTNHYSELYKNKNIFNKTFIDYSKINLINHILWINLDRSLERRNNMIDLLKNINIPNTRISGIDGNNIYIKNIVNIEFIKELNNYEIACTLSHLKAINKLKDKNGEYFMICEDDINFKNMILFDENLNNIILSSPPFDILLINKIYHSNLNELYVNWNKHLIEKKQQIASTACYIISKNGINKIINNCEYIDDNTFLFKNTNNKFDVADMYLYKNLETFVYKYNFVSTNDKDSIIHEDHVNFHNLNTKFQFEIIADEKLLK